MPCQHAFASAGNRTRATSMATMYSTTRPLMLCSLGETENVMLRSKFGGMRFADLRVLQHLEIFEFLRNNKQITIVSCELAIDWNNGGDAIGILARNTTCRDPGSNRRPSDLQSDALPTELSRLASFVLQQTFLCKARHGYLFINSNDSDAYISSCYFHYIPRKAATNCCPKATQSL